MSAEVSLGITSVSAVTLPKEREMQRQNGKRCHKVRYINMLTTTALELNAPAITTTVLDHNAPATTKASQQRSSNSTTFSYQLYDKVHLWNFPCMIGDSRWGATRRRPLLLGG